MAVAGWAPVNPSGDSLRLLGARYYCTFPAVTAPRPHTRAEEGHPPRCNTASNKPPEVSKLPA